MRRYGAAVVMCCGFLLCGCSRSPRVTFYTLSGSTAPQPSGSGAGVPCTVRVDPVTIPELVDRPQLVVRVSETRVEILEAHRWGEPLRSGIARFLAENLGHRLDPARISVYPAKTDGPVCRVTVDLERFESVSGKNVTVEALWSVRGPFGSQPRKGHFALREPVTGPGYDPVVAAASSAFAAMAGDIAAAVRAEASLPEKDGARGGKMDR